MVPKDVHRTNGRCRAGRELGRDGRRWARRRRKPWWWAQQRQREQRRQQRQRLGAGAGMAGRSMGPSTHGPSTHMGTAGSTFNRSGRVSTLNRSGMTTRSGNLARSGKTSTKSGTTSSTGSKKTVIIFVNGHFRRVFVDVGFAGPFFDNYPSCGNGRGPNGDGSGSGRATGPGAIRSDLIGSELAATLAVAVGFYGRVSPLGLRPAWRSIRAKARMRG
jgi:hypothetical protein